MRLHDRYLFRELLTPLALCLGGFLVLGVSFFFFTQVEVIQEKKLTALDIVAYCAANMMSFFVLLLPILLLLALLWALSQHARHNEINALRAAGVGLWRLSAPYFAVGLVATAAYFVLNELAVPRCDQWAEQILERHVRKEATNTATPRATSSFSNARAHRVWQFLAYNESTTEMISPTVQWSRPNGSWQVLRADRAYFTNDVWTFFNAQMFFKPPGSDAEIKQSATTNMLAVPAFDETPDRVRLLIKFSKTQTLHASVNADLPLKELWAYMQSDPGLSREDAHALETKFQGRLATPWTCFVVVLMAIPFGSQSGRRNLFFGVAGSLFIGFAYFVLERVSLALGMNGLLPGWLAAWLPNAIFAAIGIGLILRVR
jgi:lipopolysaccharide export system permease protein